MPSLELAPDWAALGPRGSLACGSGGGTALCSSFAPPRAGQIAAMPCVARRAEIWLLPRAAQGQVSPSCAASKARKPAVEGPESPTRPPRRPFLPVHHPLLTGSVIHKIAPARGKPHLHPLCTRRLLSGGIRPMPRLAPLTSKPSLPTHLCRALARKGRASAGSRSIASSELCPASRCGTTGRGVGAAFSPIGLPHCGTRPRACVMRRHLSRSIRPGVCRNGIACK